MNQREYIMVSKFVVIRLYIPRGKVIIYFKDSKLRCRSGARNSGCFTRSIDNVSLVAVMLGDIEC